MRSPCALVPRGFAPWLARRRPTSRASQTWRRLRACAEVNTFLNFLSFRISFLPSSRAWHTWIDGSHFPKGLPRTILREACREDGNANNFFFPPCFLLSWGNSKHWDTCVFQAELFWKLLFLLHALLILILLKNEDELCLKKKKRDAFEHVTPQNVVLG